MNLFLCQVFLKLKDWKPPLEQRPQYKSEHHHAHRVIGVNGDNAHHN